MTARDDILAAIRQGLTHGSEGALPRRTPSEIASEAAALLANPAEIRPALAGPDPVAAFIAKCANPALGVTLDGAAGWDALPAAVAAYLDHHALARCEAVVLHHVRIAELVQGLAQIGRRGAHVRRGRGDSCCGHDLLGKCL